MSFGENLINLRRQKGWSQDDLANNLNISRQAISKWENNTSKPDVDNIEKISKIFSVKIDELLNNELPNDKAVALDVKKEEKKEKTITIVKLMIIAVIILYAISVIYKFASVLVIVNGVQKYANLNNYHYVIKTYNNSEIVQKEECWLKDGVSKTASSLYYDGSTDENTTYIDFTKKSGYTKNNNEADVIEMDVENYLNMHKNYEDGIQLFTRFPLLLQKQTLGAYILICFNLDNFNIDIYDENIILKTTNDYIFIDKATLLPKYVYYNQDNSLTTYDIELNSVDQIER